MDTSTDSATFDSYSFNCDNSFKVPEAVPWNLKPPVENQWNPAVTDPSLDNLKPPVENQWNPIDTDPSLGNSISLFRGINFEDGSKFPTVHPQFEEGPRFETNQTFFQAQNQGGLFRSETDMSFQVEERGFLHAPYRHMLPPIIEDGPIDRNAASHTMNKIQFVPATSPGGQVQFNTNSGIIPSGNEGQTPFNAAYGNIQASPTVERRQFNANYSGIQAGNIQASPTVEGRQFNANYSGIQSGNIQASPTVERRQFNANYSGIQVGNIQASPTVESRQFNANYSEIQAGNIQASPTLERRQINANYSGIQSRNIQASPTVERRQLNANYRGMQSPIHGRRLLDVSYRDMASSTPNKGSFEANRAVFPRYSKQLINNNQSMPVNKTVLPSSFGTNRGVAFPHSIQVLTTNNQSLPVNKTMLPSSFDASKHQQILRTNEVNSAVFQHSNSGGIQLATINQTAQTQFGDKIVPTNVAAGGRAQFFTKNETVPGQFGERRQVDTGNTSSIVVGDRAPLRTYSGIKAEGDFKDNTGTVPLQFQGGRSVRPEAVVDQSMMVDSAILDSNMNNVTMSPFRGGVIQKPNKPTMISSNDGIVTNLNMVAPTIPDSKMNNATMSMSSFGGGVIPKRNIHSKISSSKGGHSAIDKMFSGRAFNKENIKPSTVSGSTNNKPVSSSVRPTGGVFNKENMNPAIDEERGNINQHTFQAAGERQTVRPTKDVLSCRQGGGEKQNPTNNFGSSSMIGERKQTNTTDLSLPSLSSVSSNFVTPATIGGRNDFNTANMIGERKMNTTTDLSLPSLSSASNTFVTPTMIGGRKELFDPSKPPQIGGAPTDISLASSFADHVGPNQGTDEMRHMNMETDDGNNAESQENSQSSQNSHFLESFTLRKLDAAACLAEPVRLGPLLMREVLDQIPDNLLIAALSDPKLDEHFQSS
ncbi:uncharacterized protein LOC111055132 isoform X2 [Nilaparvata lugens]|nr:uncharacterized protein LOC111055132 isoform X2 [Nilaparvata lugens]